jgi:ligand-binding SRPBCC domain-containing protein
VVTLETTTLIYAPVERCFDLARSVEVHVLGNVHYGEAAVAAAGVTSGLIGLGERVTWRAKHFWIWQTLTSRITAMERPVYFQDVMIQGAFRSMKHDHYFRQLTAGLTEMKDVFSFEAPFALLGRVVEAVVLRRYMNRLLKERNDVIRNVAESAEWQKYLPASGGAR